MSISLLDRSASARNKSYLKILGITHVLNAAEGSRAVETNREYYSDMPRISYMGFAIRDLPTTGKLINDFPNSDNSFWVLLQISRNTSTLLPFSSMLVSRVEVMLHSSFPSLRVSCFPRIFFQ